jgi:hypothetical protein
LLLEAPLQNSATHHHGSLVTCGLQAETGLFEVVADLSANDDLGVELEARGRVDTLDLAGTGPINEDKLLA